MSNLSNLRNAARAIGVFDSGIGGLTVLRALRAELPLERFVYLGDTARLPYGTKSRATIQRYAVQAAQLLMQREIKCLVVACNTASSVALEQLQQHFAPLPVLGVVGPGAIAGARASKSGSIAVIATDAILTKAQTKRLAIMADDGLARAIRPAHAPMDGDTVFACATQRKPLPEGLEGYALMEIGMAAGLA